MPVNTYDLYILLLVANIYMQLIIYPPTFTKFILSNIFLLFSTNIVDT